MSDRRRLSHNLAASSTSTILGRTSDSSMLMTSMLDSASLAEHTSGNFRTKGQSLVVIIPLQTKFGGYSGVTLSICASRNLVRGIT